MSKPLKIKEIEKILQGSINPQFDSVFLPKESNPNEPGEYLGTIPGTGKVIIVAEIGIYETLLNLLESN